MMKLFTPKAVQKVYGINSEYIYFTFVYPY